MKILVPIDFTAITENALKYAIGLTEAFPVSEIVLFHVVDSEKDAAVAKNNLNVLIQKYEKQTKTRIVSNIQPGNIFDQIGSAAEETNSSLIVMGTHGIKGMQHIIGSKAMKVITNSKIPYIVVQKLPYKKINKILLPVDYTKETKQILPFVHALNKKLKAKLVLANQKSSDEFINKKINNNLNYYESFLKDNNYSYKEAGMYSESSKYKDILALANSTQTDLIVAAIDPETDIADYIMGVEEQKIVANESQIPVLCVNFKYFMKIQVGFFASIA